MIKLAFSTLACPEWSFTDIVEAACKYEYDGIEFRGLMSEIDLPNVPEFTPARIAGMRKTLEKAGLCTASLSSSVSVVTLTASDFHMQTAVANAERYIEMAQAIGAPYIRLFCGNVPPDLSRDIALQRAADTLRRIGDFAQPRGVVAVVETHDSFVRTDLLMELILLANHPAVQVLWDIHHPYRLEGETIAQSMRNLDGHVFHTHIKDSAPSAEGEGYAYTLLGHGDVPILDAMRALNQAGYDGYYSLEWEKRWVPTLEGPESALPQYVEQMRAWEKEL